MRALPRMGDFDPAQLEVIEAPATRRALVTAGPGTGKTAVACARLAHLVARGAPASTVLMVSFTRTAVVELRNRIRAASECAEAAAGVRIVTLDSEAWRLRHGFTEEEVARFGGYDANIDAVLRLLRNPSDELLDYLGTFRHVFVDEAQDLTEQRGLLVFRLLGLLEEECGFTVFGDRAQAIYGFTSGEDGAAASTDRPVTLLDRIEYRWSAKVAKASLERVYRAATASTLAVFARARQAVLCTDFDGPARQQAVLDLLHGIAPGLTRELEDEVLYGDGIDGADVLWLFRQRREALLASAELARLGRPHRLRLPQLPVWLHPWIVDVLGEFRGSFLTRNDFDARSARLLAVDGGAEGCWRALVEVAGGRGEAVDVARLRRALLQARQDHLLARPEFGARVGPTLGTIHASKGREARRVILELSTEGTSREGADEEARVAYVGATRALEELYVRVASHRPSRRTDRSGRLFSPGQRSARIEIGLADDLTPGSTVAKNLHASEKDAVEVQHWLASLDGAPMEVGIVSERFGDTWRNVLCALEGPPYRLGVLAPGVVSDLFEIGRNIGIARPKLPQLVAGVHLLGARACVADSRVERDSIYEPWATSGIFLVPVFHGFPRVPFNLQPGPKHAR